MFNASLGFTFLLIFDDFCQYFMISASWQLPAGSCHLCVCVCVCVFFVVSFLRCENWMPPDVTKHNVRGCANILNYRVPNSQNLLFRPFSIPPHPSGPGPKWTRVQVGPGPKWAQGPSGGQGPSSYSVQGPLLGP